MTTPRYEYQSDFARRHFAAGMAKAVLTILEDRGIPVSDDAFA